MNTRMNLTGFADLAHEERAAKGQPLPIPVDDILPDPDNPRNADDENAPAAVEAQKALDADVAERGIKTPISVRPHPTIRGKYVINYGHRRHKSVRNNGLSTIPGFVDDRFDSYDQFNENELRTSLSTRARALFIKSRLDAGDTKGEIAQRMRKKNQNFITEHLALIDAPECVNRAYSNGVTSARTLYDLRQAWEEFPVEVDSWCQHVPQVTREGIKDALENFRCCRPAFSEDQVGAVAETSSTEFRHDEKVLQSKRTGSSTTPKFRHDEKVLSPEPAAASAARQFRHDEKSPPGGAQLNTPAITNDAPPPDDGVVIVQYKGKRACVVPGTTVSIIVDGAEVPLNVPLSELVFK
ncbi:ParB/RepB/Spo0J family partition protein [Massilia sp. GER05]|uniref:ParB/RepB/Spo0J family partition protein n=1 Tax=Massilia sp. GER05 TaxID=3394605 RepID=UPI003F84B08D